MATYYVQARKTGPSVVYVITANSRQAAIAILAGSAAAGEEYDVMDASTTLASTGTTGPTGPTGATGVG